MTDGSKVLSTSAHSAAPVGKMTAVMTAPPPRRVGAAPGRSPAGISVCGLLRRQMP